MFDAHVHFQDTRLDGCRTAVLAAARAAGVRAACCCGAEPSDWQAVTDLAAAPELRVVPAFGVHPWYVRDLPADWCDALAARLTSHPRAPVGEIGFDGLRDDLPGDLQRAVLEKQLALAARLDRPVVLHGARAWGTLLDILRPFARRLPAVMAHGFAGSADVLREFLSLGAYISFAGSVCSPRARHVRAAAAQVPAERLLAETDTPDIFPPGGTPAPGSDPAARLNHPGNLSLVLAALAEVRGATPPEVASLTAANAAALFGVDSFAAERT